MKQRSRLARTLSTCMIVAQGTALFAQQTAAPSGTAATAPTEDEETVVLSLFEVNSEESGWTATVTLAGSRLRTNYKDVATQLEALTMDFMDDFNLNSVEEASIYSLNVSNSSEHNEASSVSTGIVTNLSGNLIVRGLAQATNSREFFGLIAPNDNYNIDRIDIASGPNSILFGTGSPAGVINATLSRARFKDGGSVKAGFDSWGSTRFDLDYNKVVIDDVLAVRFAAVNYNRKFEEEPSRELSKRYYGALMFKPYKNTSFSLHYEDVDIESRRPSRVLPFDLITPWFEATTIGGTGVGYPNQYLFPNSQEWITGRDLNGDGKVDGHLNDPIPASGSFGARSFATGQRLFQTDNSEPTIVSVNGRVEAVSSLGGMAGVQGENGWNPDPVNSAVNGFTLKDDRYFPTDYNTVYDARTQNSRSQILNLFFNQTLAENLFFEFALQAEDNKNLLSEALSYLDGTNIQIDVNQYLSDGITPNPHAGEFFVEGSTQYVRRNQENRDWRAALSYEFDFKDKTDGFWSHLGRHRFAGLTSFNERKNNGQEFQYQITPKVAANGQFYDPAIPNHAPGLLKPVSNNWLKDGDRRLRNRLYVDPISKSAPLLPQQIGQPWSFTDANGEEWIVDAEHVMTSTDGRALVANRANAVTNQATKQNTNQLSYQGFFWNDRIIATYGWRKDTINSTENLPDQSSTFVIDPRNGNPVQASTWGLLPHYRHNELQPYDSANEEEGTTSTFGVVVHPLRGWLDLPLGADISFSYNESDTFQPPGGGALVVDGSRLRGTEGEGTDKGIRLGLFHGRMSVSYNQFENTAEPFSIGLPFRRFRFSFQDSLRVIDDGLAPDLYNTDPNCPGADWAGDPAKFFPRGLGANYADPYVVTSFNEAKGQEIQLFWRVTNNLDLRFNWSKQTSVQSDIATDWIRFADEYFPYMDGKLFKEDYDGTGRDMNGDGDTTDTFTWDQIPRGNNWQNWNKGPNVEGGIYAWGNLPANVISLRQHTFNQVYVNGGAPVPLLEAYDGKPNDFTRQNRWNVNARYNFLDGRLRGFSVGGAYRYREAPVVGFLGKTVAGQQVPDVDNPILGEEEGYFDLSFGYRGKLGWLGDRRYRVNLTIFNVLDEDDPVPTTVRVTGEPLVLARVDGRRANISFEVDF